MTEIKTVSFKNPSSILIIIIVEESRFSLHLGLQSLCVQSYLLYKVPASGHIVYASQ